MIAELSEHITQKLVEYQAIQSEERELYRYGIQQVFNIICNLITIVVIGLLLNKVWESLIFTTAYIPLRSYAGGYHAKTPKRCYLFSCMMIIAVLLAMKILSLGSFICSCLAVTGSICILIFAPVGTANKPLDDKEKWVYRKKTRWILLFEILFFVLATVSNLTTLSMTLSFSLFVSGGMVVLGIVSNYISAISKNDKSEIKF